MSRIAVTALRVVLAMLMAGSVFVLAVMVPLIATDLRDIRGEPVYFLVLTIIVLGIVSAQVVLFSVWRLVTMVRENTVFSDAAFRHVDWVIGAFAFASILVFAFAVVLAPGDAAPGVVLLICGVALAVFGVALVVLVLRMLLAQAVARDAEANELKAELDEVI